MAFAILKPIDCVSHLGASAVLQLMNVHDTRCHWSVLGISLHTCAFGDDPAMMVLVLTPRPSYSQLHAVGSTPLGVNLELSLGSTVPWRGSPLGCHHFESRRHDDDVTRRILMGLLPFLSAFT